VAKRELEPHELRQLVEEERQLTHRAIREAEMRHKDANVS
jgi:hypothetical protein